MTNSAYERIRDAIITGQFPAGHVLAENTLASEFGMSRTPIREALHRLEVERLVERGPRGAYVRASSPDEILDIYDVRITLEGAAARRAAQNATDLDLTQLQAAQNAMRRVGHTASARAESNRHFHETIWAASHSATLVDLLGRLNIHLIRYPTTTLTWGDRWEQVLQEHDELLTAINERDRDKAREIAERHMTGAREIRLRMYADNDTPG